MDKSRGGQLRYKTPTRVPVITPTKKPWAEKQISPAAAAPVVKEATDCALLPAHVSDLPGDTQACSGILNGMV